MPDTYLSFCIGYGIFLGFTFLLIAILLLKTQKLEAEVRKLQGSQPG